MKFKAFHLWPTALYALFAALGLVALAVPVLRGAEYSRIVAGVACALGMWFVVWRWVDLRRTLEREHVSYNQLWQCNVFCVDGPARGQWHHNPRAANREISDAFAEVAAASDGADRSLGGLQIRIRANLLAHPKLSGLQRGVYDNGVIHLVWLFGKPFPGDVLRHELAHAVVSRGQGIDGDRAHERMRELGMPW